MELTDGVLRWRMVRLALADQLDDSRLREEHLLELVSKALGADVTAEAGWREKARVAILNDVVRELDAEASLAGESASVDDQARAALAGYLRSQAKLAGVAASEIQTASTPSALLRLLVNAASAKLSAAGTPAAKQFVERTPHELSIADYLATSELAQAVRLQRILIAAESLATQSEKPSAATQISEIENELHDQDRRATHIYQQLLSGERTRLKLWLLRNAS
jgi:hypothetical protein